jgi:hypothetical protein
MVAMPPCHVLMEKPSNKFPQTALSNSWLIPSVDRNTVPSRWLSSNFNVNGFAVSKSEFADFFSADGAWLRIARRISAP